MPSQSANRVVVTRVAEFIKTSGLNGYQLFEITKRGLFDLEFSKHGVVLSLRSNRTIAYVGLLNNKIATKIVSASDHTKEMVFAITAYIHAKRHSRLECGVREYNYEWCGDTSQPISIDLTEHVDNREIKIFMNESPTMKTVTRAKHSLQCESVPAAKRARSE
jgi:hypothetical protein